MLQECRRKKCFRSETGKMEDMATMGLIFLLISYSPRTPTLLYPINPQIKINKNAPHPYRRHPFRLSRVQPPRSRERDEPPREAGVR